MGDLRHRVARAIWSSSFTNLELRLASEPETPDEFLPQADEALADSLDAAWAEAEAALPKARSVDFVVGPIYDDDMNRTGQYEATVAVFLPPQESDFRMYSGVGPTPAAALRALAAKLRDETHTK